YEIGADSIFSFTIIDNDSPLPAGPPFTRTIGQIRGNNTGNAADSTGRNVRLYGTVYGVNQRLTTTGGGYQMYLRDATGGIGIFKTSSFGNIPVLSEGDSVKVMGTINVFRGLSQITPDSMVVLATGRNLKNPTVALKVNESLESDLVRINGVQLVDPTKWTTGVGATGFTVKVFKGTDTTDVRIDNDCPLYSQPAPIGTFDIVGMGSQFSVTTTSPWNGGYQLIPRKLADVITTPVVTPKPKVSFVSPSLTFAESNGNQFLSIVMSNAPSVLTTPTVYFKGGTASAGTDYVESNPPSGLIGPFTSLTSDLPVQFLDDVVNESTETLTMVLRKSGLPSDTAYEIGADSIFTFTITDNDVSVTEPLPPTRKIAEIRGNNTGNQADSVGKSFRVYGTVYGHNQRAAGTGYQMFIRDETGGIGIFKTSTVNGIQNLTEGDSIKIMGKVEVFRGLSQINPDSIVLLATNRSIKNPVIVSNIGETEEAQLVRFNNVTLVNQGAWTTGTGASGFTVQITDGTNITDVRIDNDCPLYNQPAPTGAFDLIGMGSQFVPGTPAPVAPFPATGYQLIPRRNSDLIPAGTPTGPVASFAIASQSVGETNDTVRVNVLIAPAPAEAYRIQVIVKGGTATGGSDYDTPATVLTFPANASSAQFKIKLIDDAVLEGLETIQLVLRKDNSAGFPPYANVGLDSLHTVTILANDGSTQEPFPPTRTIAVIRGNNTGNQADSVGKNVRIYGTIYGLNQRLTPTGAGYQMFIRDATGGIGVFKTSFASGISTLTEGDSVKIMGTVNVFRGLSQITPDSMVVLATNRPIKTPVAVTVLDDALEGDLVILNGPLTVVDPSAWTTGTGASGFTVKVTDGTNVTDVRIDNDCELYNQAAPTSPFTLTGMGSQFANGTAPWVGGYQLIPRRASDLQIIDG
ncbi:MAG TPA: Calx-beta domain-containing protein, partial [Catalimonadaceae bacterium]|nr:Calx-beta domain-containing protein [Catalimonadaceae bacterium]